MKKHQVIEKESQVVATVYEHILSGYIILMMRNEQKMIWLIPQLMAILIISM